MKLLLFFSILLLTLVSCNNANYQIHQVCEKCINTHIEGTPYVLATNPSDNFSNIWDKDKNAFLFDAWFHISFEENDSGNEIKFNTNDQQFTYSLDELASLTQSDILQRAGIEQNQAEQTEQEQVYESQESVSSEQDEPSINEGVSISWLSKNVYENNENGFKTYIHFEKNYSEQTGVMTLSQPQCRYVYNVEISGNTIDATFFDSECGASSENTTLYYTPSDESIYMKIGGQKFTFRPVF